MGSLEAMVRTKQPAALIQAAASPPQAIDNDLKTGLPSDQADTHLSCHLRVGVLSLHPCHVHRVHCSPQPAQADDMVDVAAVLNRWHLKVNSGLARSRVETERLRSRGVTWPVIT